MNTAAELAQWVPSTILAGGCLMLLGIVGRIMLKRLEALEKKIEGVSDFATKKELGNMGDRFDGRFGEVRENIGGIRERLATLEAKTSAIVESKKCP